MDQGVDTHDLTTSFIVMMMMMVLTVLTCQLDLTSANEATTCTSGWDVIDRPSVETLGGIFASPDTKFDCDGILTEWRFQSKTSTPFKAIVWRHVELTKYSVVGINTIAGGYPADQEVMYTVPDNERIMVRAGDVISWAFPSDGIALQYTDTKGGTQVLNRWDTIEPLVQDSLIEGQVVDINAGGYLRDYSIKASVLGFYQPEPESPATLVKTSRVQEVITLIVLVSMTSTGQV